MKIDLSYGKSIALLCIILNVSATQAQNIVKTSVTPHITSSQRIPEKIQPLTIGDKVPDIFFHNVLNYKNKTAKLSDFKGKLILLDMWSTTCSACIGAFPKMDELQEKFKNDLQVLLVNSGDLNYNSENRVNTILGKVKSRTGFYPSLPIPINDTVLNEYFPHKYVPHYVWINASGTIIAITSATEVTAENIQKAINNDLIRLPLKKDLIEFDRDKPLFVDYNGGAGDNFTGRSIVTPHIDGLGGSGGVRRTADGKITRMYWINLPLLSLYRQAYSNLQSLPENRLSIEVSAPEKFEYSTETRLETTWCYELVVPPTSRDRINEFMQQDLARYFGYEVVMEKREKKCFVLYATDKLKNYVSKKDAAIDLETASLEKFMNNQPIPVIARELNSFFNVPLLDETNLPKTNLDIQLPFDLSDEAKLIQSLQAAGFIVKEEVREIEIAVIRDIED